MTAPGAAPAITDLPLVLTDGGIETRLMFGGDVELDPDVQVAGLVADPDGGPALRAVYESYVAAARAADVPLVIGTPTFRASLRYAERAGLDGEAAVRRLNQDAVELLRDVRAQGEDATVFIAGVIGPFGDAYTPVDCLGVDAAERYHALQARTLADAGVDVLFAPTFPSVDEALGAARALGATGLPSCRLLRARARRPRARRDAHSTTRSPGWTPAPIRSRCSTR